ncbi:hypothetical protein [Moorena producens]|uniref:hypothetical protein n=1 Tax=Moorena producens TaxID=1155739 RepID=UPI003C792554
MLTHSVSRSSKLSYLLNQGVERVALESGVDFRGYLKEESPMKRMIVIVAIAFLINLLTATKALASLTAAPAAA